MKKEQNLLKTIQQIIDLRELNDALLKELLSQIKIEFAKSRQKRPKIEKSISSIELISVDQALILCKKLQQHVDHNRGSFVFANKVPKLSEDEIDHGEKQQPVISMIHQSAFFGKEIFLLLAWSSLDPFLKNSFSNIRRSAKKNGWKSNRRKLEKHSKKICDWLSAMTITDKFGFFPYDFSSEGVNWSEVHSRMKKAIFADIEILQGLMDGTWPEKSINKAYSSMNKADIFFQWSAITLKKILQYTSDESKQKELHSILREIYWHFNVELDFDSYKVTKGRRTIRGDQPRFDPMYFGKTLGRLEKLIM